MKFALALGLLVFLLALAAFHRTLCAKLPLEPLPDVENPSPIPVVRGMRTEALGEAERAEGERVLSLFWKEWGAERARHELAQAMGGYDCLVVSRGHFELEPYQPEFRLWVQGYPSVADAWARKAIQKSDYRSENRVWAFRAIRELSMLRYPGAEDQLKELGGDPDYREAAYLSLRELRELSREVDVYVPDGVLRSLILELDVPWVDEQCEWALRIARGRAVPWLEEVLRARMGDRSPRVPMGDEAYDIFLLTLAESGAPVSADERAYLRRYGYGCEPRARLAEVLKEKGY